jgi:hypothetical protein
MKTMAGPVEKVGQTGSSLFLPEESPTVYLILWWISILVQAGSGIKGRRAFS